MNHEAISQLCFSEAFEVTPAQTAAALFTRLPFGARHADRMAEVLASTALLAQLESICIDALQPHVRGDGRCVLGRRLSLDHRGTATVGERVIVSGFVTRMGDRSVQFSVSAEAAAGGGPLRTLAQGALEFVVADGAPPTRPGTPPTRKAPAVPANHERLPLTTA